ncbi:DUF4260 family protein [Halonotius terrestris]|uniref:DUF4260 family protein n=1 Tax=Halonotius terrestris TaxID=2487750 RepID=A0A8J8TCV0_9EURY|nr:DUF4260 domain-containing protein [Halonotius terrestris]TQQ81246.1 DUF4260 family protein [Halonotius terrestris]
MTPQRFLRAEGFAVLVVVLGSYASLDGSLWLLAIGALLPDVSMLGYLAGRRIGSRCYNIVHTYTLPLAVGGVGLWVDIRPAVLVALIWAGHIGADRFLGYGLKYDTGFTDTHLATQPAPIAALRDDKERRD